MKKLSKDVQYCAKKNRTSEISIRAKVEYVFLVVKKLFKYRKTQYRGIEKQTQKMNMMFALSNLYMDNKKLSWLNLGLPL